MQTRARDLSARTALPQSRWPGRQRVAAVGGDRVSRFTVTQQRGHEKGRLPLPSTRQQSPRLAHAAEKRGVGLGAPRPQELGCSSVTWMSDETFLKLTFDPER